MTSARISFPLGVLLQPVEDLYFTVSFMRRNFSNEQILNIGRLRSRIMRQRRLLSLQSGDADSAASELCLLAREVRRRQHLTRSMQPARLQPLPPHEAVFASKAAPTVVVQQEDVDEVHPGRSEASSPQNHTPAPQLLGCRRPAAKERNKAQCGYGGTRRRKRRSNTIKNDTSNHHPSSAKNFHHHRGDDQTLDPGVEATMLRVFSGDGRNRGVSVSAIRRLYRKRHEEEKARAMEEVRHWWRVGRSEAAPLAEASVAASLMPAFRAEDAQNSPDGTTAVGLADNNGEHPKLHVNDASGVKVADGKSSTANGFHDHPSRRESHDREQTHYRIFEDLDCRQVLQDPSYAATVVRDVKQALRAGQLVKIRSRQEPSLGRGSSADNQLMLRTLYMQCVGVSAEAVNCRQFNC